ncbi:MAG: hypothetical protein JJE39_01515 [Vicinamibacteria bacterium]|nr:hypothetical protein [Vicinamibacteria bacterium]
MIATLEKLYGTYLGGWARFRREHFTVFAGPREGPLAAVDAPPWSYFADPFPWVHAGEPWLLMEEFQYFKNHGRLITRRLSGGPSEEIHLDGRGHASFPCVFEIDGELHLLPETGEDGTLDLYVCERFPDRWRLRHRLLRDVDAADSVPLFHDGRWWVISSLRESKADGGHRSLGIFQCEDLRTDAPAPHPVNRERRYVDSPYSYGRSAGPIHVSRELTMFRPIQISRKVYGEALGWTRIDLLSATQFVETLCEKAPSEVGQLPGHPLHHVAGHGPWLACDTRDRRP